MSRVWRYLAVLVLVALAAAACSSDDDDTETTAPTSTPADDGDDGEGDDDGGEAEATATPVPAEERQEELTSGRAEYRVGPADSSLEPVRIGLMNQENDPIGSFPEFREGVEGMIEYLNNEEGGINGHPLELEVCLQNSPEVAQACAQELASADLVSVINGINIWTLGFDLYGTMGDTPVIGGLPLFGTDYNAPNARYFNGGSISVYAAMGRFLGETLEADSVAILATLNPGGDAAVDDGLAPVLDSYGVDYEIIGLPLPLTDATPMLTQAAALDADYTLLLASGGECIPVIRAANTLGIPPEQMFYSATCAEATVYEEVGDMVVGSWMARGGYTREDPWAPAEVIANFEDTLVEDYIPGVTETPFAGLGVITMYDLVDLYREIGVENLSDPANIFAAADDGSVRGTVGSFGWSCVYADIGLASVCSGDNLFVKIVDSDGNSEPPPNDGAYVNGLELLGG